MELCDEIYVCCFESLGVGVLVVRVYLDVGVCGGAVLKRRGGVVETICLFMCV